MFPLRDENPTLNTAVVTFAIVGLNALVWALFQGFGTEPALSRSVCQFGAIPGELLGTLTQPVMIPMGTDTVCIVGQTSNWLTPLTSIFLHGNWIHIIGNMWFLLVFGDNVEDAMGPWRFAAFYLLCGLAAVAAHGLVSPTSPLPMVGASGAIGGVMGAYAVLYPKVRVQVLLVLGFFITVIKIQALWMLGYWLLIQVVGGLPAVAGATGVSGVAFWAHIGGVMAGVGLFLPFRDPARLAPHRLARGDEEP